MSSDGVDVGHKKVASEHVFEIRYRPNARILDRRGEWVEELSKHMELPTWNIGTNRLDLYDETSGHRGFVSFANSGYAIPRAPTQNYFPDHVLKFFKFVLQLRDFPKPVHVHRIGVRQRFLTPVDGKFEDLVRRYTERYLKLTDAAVKAIDGKLIDIAGPTNFADQHGNFNTTSGPVPQAQAKELLEAAEPDGGFPEVGFYYDIDYWLRPEKDMPDAEILKTIRTFSVEGWGRHERVKELIIGA